MLYSTGTQKWHTPKRKHSHLCVYVYIYALVPTKSDDDAEKNPKRPARKRNTAELCELRAKASPSPATSARAHIHSNGSKVGERIQQILK